MPRGLATRIRGLMRTASGNAGERSRRSEEQGPGISDDSAVIADTANEVVEAPKVEALANIFDKCET